MLINFFELDDQPEDIASQAELFSHLKFTNDLRDFIYRPNELRPTPDAGHPKIKIEKKTFTNVSFSKTLIKDVIFTNVVFKDCLFIGSTIEDCEFHSCRFENVNTYKIEIRRTYVNPENFRNAVTDSKYSNIAVHLFQRIYDALNDRDQPLLAREAEYYFLDWERRYLIQKFKNKKIDNKSYLKKIIPKMLHYFVGYGIRFSVFFRTYFIFLFVFGFLNYILWNSYAIKTDLFEGAEIRTVIHVVYFTFYTSTSLGAGEMFPQSDLGILLAVTQSAIGYIFIGVFLSMLIKKIVR